MEQIIHVALFWIAVVVIIRVAVWFPDSLPARVLFWRIDPAPLRGEPEHEHLLRSARFAASWFLQAAALFAVGRAALAWDASLVDSPIFLLFWAGVIPVLGVAALVAALGAASRAIWKRRLDHAVHRARHNIGAQP
jgi:hypothetical protein